MSFRKLSPAFACAAAITLLLATRTDAQAGAPPSKDAFKYGSPPALPSGSSIESMWPAPTAEDWAKPCLVHWQRTFEDALRIARETNRPIMACVNMDGEVASENWAGVRYRQEDTARLLEPYVCVIGSVYRHTPRDYDAEGNRVLCPRFGSVTCSEHIAMEGVLYEKVLEGKRISPRHILIELDGTKTFDVYYSWDTATVFTAYREGAKDRPPPVPLLHGDLALPERVASEDIEDREAVETAYRTGTREARRTMLESVIVHRDLDQVDLLRLAVFGLDLELARLARRALVNCETEAAVDLIAEVLKMPLEAAERADLLAAAARLAEKYPRARTLVAVHQGLGQSSRFVDPTGWSATASAAAGGTYGPPAIEGRAAAAESRPKDPEAQLQLAEALLARAHENGTERRYEPLLLEDARRAALEAETLGAKGWRLDALLAIGASARGERDEALTRAQAAIEGGMPRPGTSGGVDERTAVEVLALFAQARQRSIQKAYRERATWPSEWLADVTSAYAVLAEHPLGTDANVADGYDFLRWLGASPRAQEMLEKGLTRFPESWMLHERLRGRLLWDQGPAGLEAAYTALLAREGAPPALEWFAGYASLVAAEQHRRAGTPTDALASYGRALEHYRHDSELHPEHASSAAHYAALAHAGIARIQLEKNDLEAATRELMASITEASEAFSALDGLNLSAADTSRMLLARLDEAKRDDLAAPLRAAIAALDPKLLEPPAYERNLPEVEGRRDPRREGQGR